MSTAHAGGNIQPGLDLEEHQGALNSKRVFIVSPAPLQFAVISQSGAGTTALVGAQGGSLKIKVVSYVFTLSALGTAKFTGTADLTGAMDISATGGITAESQPASYLFETAANAALSIVTTGGAAKGHLAYFVE